MARLVKKEYKGPLIKLGTRRIWICMCGLSRINHFVMKKADEENNNKIYAYEK
jgi:hypothetical protein